MRNISLARSFPLRISAADNAAKSSDKTGKKRPCGGVFRAFERRKRHRDMPFSLRACAGDIMITKGGAERAAKNTARDKPCSSRAVFVEPKTAYSIFVSSTLRRSSSRFISASMPGRRSPRSFSPTSLAGVRVAMVNRSSAG